MQTAEKHLVAVGLGNPGKEYALTRHNMGYLVILTLAKELGWTFKEEKYCSSHVAKGKIGETNLHLLLPLTYMNESGRAVKHYLDYYKLGPQHLVVISDDADIPFGAIRLRSGGTTGGHNGLKSIQSHLHTQDYARMRMGIGREQQKERPLADYVLDIFSEEERKNLKEILEKGANIIKRLTNEEIIQVMNSL